jgi:hypothetical protein
MFWFTIFLLRSCECVPFYFILVYMFVSCIIAHHRLLRHVRSATHVCTCFSETYLLFHIFPSSTDFDLHHYYSTNAITDELVSSQLKSLNIIPLSVLTARPCACFCYIRATISSVFVFYFLVISSQILVLSQIALLSTCVLLMSRPLLIFFTILLLLNWQIYSCLCSKT